MEIKVNKVDGNTVAIRFGADKIYLDNEQAMRVADAIVNEIIIEDMAESFAKEKTQEEIDQEVGEWEYQAKFGNEGDY
jgi:predicted SpoU family rRNA methylase